MKKGIILAGGHGTRLRPLSDFMCKQLLPVYDKPMIYYPLSTLILLGLKDILIISTPKDTPVLQAALGDGSHLGIRLTYKVQDAPRGLADAFILGEEHIGDDTVCLMLGDNILHASHLGDMFAPCIGIEKGAYIVGVPVMDAQRFGVIETDTTRTRVLSLEEKPAQPKSNMAAIGLYFYDNSVIAKAKGLAPSSRGELEITDLNNLYLAEGSLQCKFLSRGATWLDAGTFDTLADSSRFIQIVENRLGLKIGCIEEASFVMGNIDKVQILKLAQRYTASPYGAYLRTIAEMSY